MLKIQSFLSPSFFLIMALFAVLSLSGCSSSKEDSVESEVELVQIPSPQNAIPETNQGVEDSDKNTEISEPEIEINEMLSEDSIEEGVVYEVGKIQPYNQAFFDAAKADGKKILLDFYASWCPICRSNAPIIEAGLVGTDIVAFRIEYDTAEELNKLYGVTYQSTYIVLEGESEERKSGYLTEASFKELIGA